MKHFQNIVWFGLLLVLASSCSTKHIKYIQDHDAFFDEETAKVYADSALVYRLKQGDFLTVDFITSNEVLKNTFPMPTHNPLNTNIGSNNATYFSQYQINSSGDVKLPFFGEIPAEGLTIDTLQHLFQQRVDTLFSNTLVVIRLAGSRIAFLGEVNKQGYIQFAGDKINILQALAMAGGVTDYGNKRNIMILRTMPTGRTVHRIDITNRSIIEQQQFYLQPDDIVFIEPVKGKMLQLTLNQYLFIISTIVSTVSVATLIFARNG